MKQYKGCMACHLVDYEGTMVDEKTFYQLAGNDGRISHGVCKNELCGLELAMVGANITNAKEELPAESYYMFENLLRIYEKN